VPRYRGGSARITAERKAPSSCVVSSVRRDEPWTSRFPTQKVDLTTRCDLQLHSSASLTTGQWFSQYFQAPESYADPLRQYELCKTRGMTLVTLTDHDSIERVGSWCYRLIRS